MYKLYLAGPLFTHGERMWNRAVATGLREAGYEVTLPQEGVSNGHGATAATLFQAAISGVANADAVVAIVDGADPDSGTAFECGYGYALGKRVIGVRTDLRSGGDQAGLEGNEERVRRDVNLMLANACGDFVRVEGIGETPEQVVRQILSCLRQVV